MNTASRIQSAAAPGSVLVGERTYRAAASSVAFEPVEPLVVKGKTEPVAAWRALRVVGEVGGSGRGPAPEPPFVGRDEDLRLAKELLRATEREHRLRLLSVTGVAGIGKSRLVWELRKYVDGLAETVYWHQGRCPAYGEGITFWAFAEMVRGRAGIAETDDEATARQRLAACLADLPADPDERAWLQPRLGHLLGLDPAPPGGREELFGAWQRFIERVAERGTTVLVFEDLHWADPGLMDFLESLLTWARSSPILVITLARPELAERRPGWAATVRASTNLHLDPISDQHIRGLVNGYVEGLPEADLHRLVERAEGIPLYAVEMVRMLADRGVLEQGDAGYRVVADLDREIEVPESLHALVAARLDGLPEDERALVLDASVAGHSFTLETVCALSERLPDDTEAALQTLVRKEIFDHEADPRSAERGQYRFVQAVVQEVAHSTLSKAARRARHLACARWLAERDEDELAGVVASHFLEAYRAEPSAADAEELAGQATRWLRTAAERAFTLGSPESAHRYAVAALDLAGTTQERAALHARAATGAAMSGDFQLAWPHYVAASEAYQAADDPEAEGRLLAGGIRHTLGAGDLEQEFDRALVSVEQRLLRPSPSRVLVLSALADRASARGQREDALRWSEEALVLAQALHDEEALGAAAGCRTWALFLVDRNFEAAMLAEGVMALARRSGSAAIHSEAAIGYGVILSASDPRAALQAWLEAAEVAGRVGIRRVQGLSLANAAEAAIDLGELDTAAATISQAGEITISAGLEHDGLALSRALLAAYRGSTAVAHDELAELEAQRREAWTSLMMKTWFLRTRSAVRLIDGDAPGALSDAVASIALDASGGNAGTSLWHGIQAAARAKDTDALAGLLEDTAGLRGEQVEAIRAVGEATLAALRGQPEAAAEGLHSAMARSLERNMPLDHAFIAGIALHVLAGDLVPQAEVEAARTRLGDLGAAGLLRLL